MSKSSLEPTPSQKLGNSCPLNLDTCSTLVDRTSLATPFERSLYAKNDLHAGTHDGIGVRIVMIPASAARMMSQQGCAACPCRRRVIDVIPLFPLPSLLAISKSWHGHSCCVILHSLCPRVHNTTLSSDLHFTRPLSSNHNRTYHSPDYDT